MPVMELPALESDWNQPVHLLCLARLPNLLTMTMKDTETIKR